jgi:hypothetical protein
VIASDQCQLHAHQHHYHQHADHGEHVLGEEDQAVAEEHPHGLYVDGRARQQLPGLVAVEEAVGEPLHVAVHGVSQVVFDSQREAAGQPPPEQHQHPLDHARGDDQQRVGVDLRAGVTRLRGVDHLAGQVGDQQPGRLGAGGQRRGDDHLPAVRGEKAEQAAEGPHRTSLAARFVGLCRC